MRYKHKIDLWIRVLLIASVLMFLPMILLVEEGEEFILVITTVVMAIIIIPLFFGYIELGDEEVIIKLGIFRQKIKYDNIKSITLCSSYLSSMAMTKDRIEIKVYNKGYLMGTTQIGPEERDLFFDELKRRCHNLEQ